jgi:hypothetical protein
VQQRTHTWLVDQERLTTEPTPARTHRDRAARQHLVWHRPAHQYISPASSAESPGYPHPSRPAPARPQPARVGVPDEPIGPVAASLTVAELPARDGRPCHRLRCPTAKELPPDQR